MVDYIDRNNLLTSLQSGFRAKRSCTTALLKITDDIRTSLDNDKITALVLLDFSKAFDRVSHGLLLNKLQLRFNFSKSACNLIWTYLRGRRQKVFCGENSSTFRNVVMGVPQGSILGPLLFAIFINDLPEVLCECNYHMYADDVQLYLSRPLGLVEDAICRMNDDLMRVSRWAKLNSLQLNAEKSSAIIIYRKDLDTAYFPNVMLEDIVIPYSKSVRNLGIIFNTSLSWSNHINSVICRIYAALRRISLSAAFTPLNTRIMLIKALIIPLISYGCEVFCKLDSLSLRKINVAYNSAIRYCFCRGRYERISSHAKLILGCSLNTYLDMRTIIFLRNLIVTKQPDYLYEKLAFTQSSRAFSLVPPYFRVRHSESQFFVQSIRLWNRLPIHLRRSRDSRGFFAELRRHLQIT